MRIFQKSLAAAGLTIGVTAAVLAGGTGVAAAANCAGPPSVPPAYVCVDNVNPLNAVPAATPVVDSETVPSFCYFLGCTEDTEVPVITFEVDWNDGTVAEVEHMDEKYTVTGDPLGLD